MFTDVWGLVSTDPNLSLGPPTLGQSTTREFEGSHITFIEESQKWVLSTKDVLVESPKLPKTLVEKQPATQKSKIAENIDAGKKSYSNRQISTKKAPELTPSDATSHNMFPSAGRGSIEDAAEWGLKTISRFVGLEEVAIGIQYFTNPGSITDFDWRIVSLKEAQFRITLALVTAGVASYLKFL